MKLSEVASSIQIDLTQYDAIFISIRFKNLINFSLCRKHPNPRGALSFLRRVERQKVEAVHTSSSGQERFFRFLYKVCKCRLHSILKNFKGFPIIGKTVLREAKEINHTFKTKLVDSSNSLYEKSNFKKEREEKLSNKLEVCFVTSFPPNKARLSEYANNLLQKLVNFPSIGKIYVLADYSPIPRTSCCEKMEIRSVWKHDNPVSILKILLEILRLKPDVVHFNVHFQSFGKSRIANFIGLSLPFLTKLFRMKTLVTIHNFGEKVNLSICGLKPSLLNRIGIKIATKLVAMSDFVTVTVPSYINYLRKNYRCRSVTYIPHGTYINDLDPPSFNPNPHSNPGNIILMFGHMAPYKGLSVMLEAFQELLRERNDIELVIAGDDHPNFPGYLDIFKRKNLPQVEFLGYVKEEDVPKVFEKATIVVLPYLTATGTSGVFHLACGFGKPIVASDLPEIRELIKEGASAILVPPGDAKELKKAIAKLLDNPELRKEIGSRNYNFAQKESWEEVAKKFEEVYCKLR